MENSSDYSLPAILSPEISLCENKNEESKEQDETPDEEALREKADDLESSLQEAYELQRRTKLGLRKEERRLIWLQEELSETLKTIRDDRQKIIALHNEQSFTAKQIKDALSIDLKHYEATLRSKQPDLFGYCRQAATARDCLVVIHSIRQCRRHIQLAEILIAFRYASFLSEKPLNMTSPYSTSHSTATVTPTPAKASDGQSPVSSVQSSPLCPALASGGGGGVQSSLQGVKPSQVPVLRHQQTRTKTEKTKPRRLSLVKVDHRPPPVTTTTTTPVTATTTDARVATLASVDRTTAAPTTTTTTASTAATMSSSASTSYGSLTSPRTESRDVAGAAGGGSASTADVVRIEMRECESRPMWITARDVKPIVLTFVSK